MTHQSPLHWGLLGTGRINRSLIGPIRSSERSLLYGVASRSPRKAEEYASAWSIPHFYASYEAMLSDPEINVIYNSLPNGLHAEWSIKAMQMGKHVLCEKPLTITTQEADTVIQASQATGMVIAEAFMYRHHPLTMRLKNMIDSGEIGTLRMIRGSFGYTNRRTNDPRFDPGLGGGSLWDVGCYPIDYARYITDEEPEVIYGHQLTGVSGVDVMFTGLIRFPSGVHFQFDCSFITPYRALMEFTGEKGRLILTNPYKPGLNEKVIKEYDNQVRKIRVKGTELYSGEVSDMENAILDGKPSRISLAKSKANIAVIEACYQSARLSKPIIMDIN